MKNIFRIGFMGCGKSVVSACMEKSYGMEIIEMDEEIVKREKMSIPDIFERKGESYFRDAETKLLQELTEQNNKIVSCGGGIVLRDHNVELMRESGDIVLLTAKPETILERVKNDDNRPLLKGNKNVDFIQQMLEKRYPQYKKAADMIIETDGKDVSDICKEILEYRR